MKQKWGRLLGRVFRNGPFTLIPSKGLRRGILPYCLSSLLFLGNAIISRLFYVCNLYRRDSFDGLFSLSVRLDSTALCRMTSSIS